MQHILEPHYESTVDRGREQDLILAIQDTTTVNYHGLKATEGLDNLGGGGKGNGIHLRTKVHSLKKIRDK